jgi:hypothetical protein
MRNLRIPPAVQAFIVLTLIACAPGVTRADLMFDVTVNTSALIGNPAGPFSLDFQLINGGQPFLTGQFDDPNQATISNFNFFGGSPLGTPTLIGFASGSLSTQVVLTDPGTQNVASFVNEFSQPFAPGPLLTFHVNLTTNFFEQIGQFFDPNSQFFGQPPLPPDQFSFGILDASGFEIPTTDPTGANRLIRVDINSNNPTIQVFQGIFPEVPVSVRGVPLPAAAQLAVPLTVVAATWSWRSRRKRQ